MPGVFRRWQGPYRPPPKWVGTIAAGPNVVALQATIDGAGSLSGLLGRSFGLSVTLDSASTLTQGASRAAGLQSTLAEQGQLSATQLNRLATMQVFFDALGDLSGTLVNPVQIQALLAAS